MSIPRIYLAGPDLFYPNAQARYARLKALCAEHGLEGVAPTDGQPTTLTVTHDSNGARLLYRHDIALLRACDGVLANITPFNGLEPDAGTAYEIGFAAALGLPICTYCLDGMDTLQRAWQSGRLIDQDGRDDDGLLVENFGLPANLMLCAEHSSFPDPEKAVEHLAAILKEFDLRHSPEDLVPDLAMLVRRMARDLKRPHQSEADHRHAEAALSFLWRKGLTGSPLRVTEEEKPAALPNCSVKIHSSICSE